MTGNVIRFFRYLVFRERKSYHVKEEDKKRIRASIQGAEAAGTAAAQNEGTRP